MGVARVVFAEANDDTYRWRGDQGLLDRLSYVSPDEIPRNWNQTTIDSRLIPSGDIPRPSLIEQSFPSMNDSKPTMGTPTVASLRVSGPNEQQSGESEPPPKKRRYLKSYIFY